MPKRLIYCLLLLALIISSSILLPVLQRKKQENESNGNSISVAPGGYNALFRLLKVTNKEPVKLWKHSIMLLNRRKPTTLWLMEPDDSFFSNGAYYAKHLRSLVYNGTNLICIFKPHTQNMPIRHLNQWFNLKLSSRIIPFYPTIQVKSYFPTRRISRLNYMASPHEAEAWVPQKARRLAEEIQSRIKKKKKTKLNSTPTNENLYLIGWEPNLLHNTEIVLETMKEKSPLIVRVPYGKGSITVFANSPYFSNAQLDHADNAALAVALSERNASLSTLFEVYSAGFNEKRDIVSYLATSRGILILISLLLGLVAFCIWLTAQPIRKKLHTSKDDDRFFTQEVFIDALAKHYQSTKNWGELYEKLVQTFRHQIEQKMSQKTFDAQLALIAQNPFYEVTLADLKTCFESPLPESEADFIRLSHHLLSIQKKVNQYEQHPIHHGQPLPISSAR